MELDEKTYTTKELKNYAGKFTPKSTLTTKNIPGFNLLEPGIQSRIKWGVKAYNDYVKKYNQLRNDMLNGRVKDTENPKAKKDLQLYKNQYTKIYVNDIKKYFQEGLKKSEKNLKKTNIAKEKAEVKRRVAASKNIPPERWGRK